MNGRSGDAYPDERGIAREWLGPQDPSFARDDVVPDELELKAVVPDLDALRPACSRPGHARFRGRMSDRRYDRPGGELSLRDQVLRVRTFHHPDGRIASVIGWKGPVERSPEGYKRRAEIELPVTGTAAGRRTRCSRRWATRWCTPSTGTSSCSSSPARPSGSSGIRGWIRCSRSRASPDAIERAIRATGIPRAEFTADSLAEFVRRFELRSGQAALLALP